jgi:hypothetical protein
MISLNDRQPETVTLAAAQCRRQSAIFFCGDCAAMLALRGRGHFSDDGVADVAALALHGVAHQPAA